MADLEDGRDSGVEELDEECGAANEVKSPLRSMDQIRADAERTRIENILTQLTSDIYSRMVGDWVHRKCGLKNTDHRERREVLDRWLGISHEAALAFGEKFLGITVLRRPEAAPVLPLEETDDQISED